MPRIRVPRPFAAITFAAAVACTSNPVALCGCSLPGPHTILYGEVKDPGGAVVPAATVHVEAGAPGCDRLLGSTDMPADAQGRYRVGVPAQGEGTEQCVLVAALPPAGSSLRSSDTVQVTLPMARSLPVDSVRQDLVLRAP